MSKKRPNVIFILTDDHASHAMSCYGSVLNETPQLDRIANNGVRFDNCFCTNSLSGPSRASILTGQHTHINGVTTLDTGLDNRRMTYIKLLRDAGYQTGIVGKWHLGHGKEYEPTGFDYWEVLPGQGDYINPKFYKMGEEVQYDGYVTNIITDLSLDYMKNRDKDQPFCLLCHHKAPHRWWIPDEKYKDLYEDIELPVPETFDDDYTNRARAASVAEMRIDRDLKERDIKMPVPEGLSREERKHWLYQRYIRDYLKCVKSVDDSVGQILDYLEEEGIADDTIVVYSSDQGFFLGDHGWYDKRFMYEESLRMPFIMQYPNGFDKEQANDDIITNVDFAPTLLELCGVEVPEEMQGTSFVPILEGTTPDDWQQSMYYRYWMHLNQHNVYSHYGVRTKDYKLIFYYADHCDQPGALKDLRTPEWELFDLKKDPCEMNNVYHDSAYADVIKELKAELRHLQDKFQDTPSEREALPTAVPY
ncbi:sulfatase [Planctomycetota bacterium]|nr:sulfatase [Planctomycetota bacterium]